MLIFSFVMGFVMGGKMALVFLVTIPILGIGLIFVTRKTMPLFRRVFRKYDALNSFRTGKHPWYAGGQILCAGRL